MESFKDLNDEFAGMASPIAHIAISNSKQLLREREKNVSPMEAGREAYSNLRKYNTYDKLS